MRLLTRLLGFILFVLILFVGSVFLLPGDRIARIAADQISAQIGREVSLGGKTTVSFWPVLGIATGRMEVANASWSKNGPLMEAESLKVGVDVKSLLGGAIRITGLEAVNPKILLEKAKDGRVNWELGVEGVAPSGQSDTAGAAKSNALALTLDRALITGGQARYIDHAAGSETTVRDVDLDLRWPDYAGAADFDLTLRPAGAPLVISGRIAEFGGWIEGGVSPMQVSLSAGGGLVRFDGRSAVKQDAAGRLSVEVPNTAQMLAALGISGVEIPKGLGQAIKAEADVTLVGGTKIALRDLSASLDHNRLTGAVDLDLDGAKPRINAQLVADALELNGTSGGAPGASGGGEAASGWSDARIDASALGLLNGEMSLQANRLALGGLSFGKTRSLVTIDNSRAVFELRELQGYGGGISGQLVANNRKGLSVGGSMVASGVELQGLLTDLAGIKRFSGAADAEVSFLASGASVAAIMNAIEGKGAVKMGRGTIAGFDLDALIRAGQAGGGTTVFDSLGATFTMAGGVLNNSDLLLKLPGIDATGAGRVGLGARDADYTFTPTALEARGGKGLAIPVRIRGPWAAPKITADLEKAIDLNFKEEKKAVEAKVRDKVNQKLEKELGVTVEEGQSVEDALKKKIEEEAQKGLLKLLNRN